MVTSERPRGLKKLFSTMFYTVTVLLLLVGVFAGSAVAAQPDRHTGLTGVSGDSMTYLSRKAKVSAVTTKPAKPTGLIGAPGDRAAYLSWSKNQESDLAGYNVYCSQSSGSLGKKVNTSLVPKETPYFTHTGLTNGNNYYYRVTAVNSGNSQSYSSSMVTVRPNKPSIVKVSGSIKRTTTWQSNKIYLVDGNTTVESRYTLYIKPGAIVKFGNGIVFNIKGTVNAKGMPNYRAVFTSYSDDEAGGDTNGDGPGTQPTPGDWSGLRPQIGSSVNLNQVIIKYGRHGINYYAPQDHKYESAYFMRNLYMVDSEIYRNVDGIYIFGIRYATVRNCDIKENNHFGMMVNHCESSSIQNNRVIDNGTAGVNSKAVEICPRSLPKFKGNVLSGNVQNAVWIWDYAKYPNGDPAPTKFSYTGANATLYSDTVYVLYGGTWVSKGTKLTIQPGTVIKGQPGALVVQGELSALGTSYKPIIFTSFLDKDHGGLTHEKDMQAASGDWYGLCFEPGSNGTITGSLITYATDAINAQGASVSISDSSIVGNKFGVRNTDDGSVVAAENNWWGSADGPEPIGSGNAISSNVDADPWLNSAPF